MLKRMRPGRPSPAMVVAMIALVSAFGGSAIADEAVDLAKTKLLNGKRIKKRSIQGNRIKRNALSGTEINESKLAVVPNANKANSATSATNSTNATNATNASQLGGVAASSYQRTPRWVLVERTGTIVAQSGGISLVAHTTGRYTLDFGSPVTGHLILASSSVANDDAFRGVVSSSPCVTTSEGDPVACAGGSDPNRLQVFTDNPGETATQDHSFYVAVF